MSGTTSAAVEQATGVAVASTRGRSPRRAASRCQIDLRKPSGSSGRVTLDRSLLARLLVGLRGERADADEIRSYLRGVAEVLDASRALLFIETEEPRYAAVLPSREMVVCSERLAGRPREHPVVEHLVVEDSDGEDADIEVRGSSFAHPRCGSAAAAILRLLGPSGPLGSPGAPEAVDVAMRFGGTLVAELFESSGVLAVASAPVFCGPSIRFGYLRTPLRGAGRELADALQIVEAAATHVGSAVARAVREDERSRALRRAEALVDGSLEALLTVDSRGSVRSLNDAARRMFGLARGSEAATSIFGLVGIPPAVDRADPRLDLDAICCSDAPVEVEGRRTCGARFSAEVSVRDLRAIGEDAWIVAVRDVSAVKHAEVRIREADRLAVMGTLAAGLGHDMNNMLCPIQAHLNALAKPETRRLADREPHVEGIRSGIAYLQRLADSLHALALDPDRGECEESGHVRLDEWWGEVGALLVKGLHGRSEFEHSIADGLPPVRVPGHSLTRAILNLIVNAGEAMPAGRPHGLSRVILRASVDRAEERVALEVVDNGVGMSDEVRRRAFDVFFTTKVRGVGTGMGLPLVRRVVERAGGSVAIESRAGAGTTVRLLLPIAAAAEEAPLRRVLVSIADGRLRALVEMLLGRHEAEVRTSGIGVDFDLWIAGSESIAAGQAADWCRTHPAERLVVIARSAAAARRFMTMGVATVRDRSDLHAIARALERAIGIEGSHSKEHRK